MFTRKASECERLYILDVLGKRRNLLASVFELLRPYGYIDLSNEVLMQLLPYDDKHLPHDLNRNLLELTLKYIHETGRFD